MITSRALNETARAMATICWIAVEKSISGLRTSISTAKRREQVGRLGVHAAPVEQAVAAVFAAEKDVLGHRAERNEVDFLVDGADAPTLGVLRRREVDGLAAEDDRARVAAIGAGQHLDHRRLAGAVLADEGHDLAWLDLERGGGQRLHALEALVDVAHDEKRIGRRHRCFRRCRARGSDQRRALPPAAKQAGGVSTRARTKSPGDVRTRSAAPLWRCWRRRSGRD